MKQFILLTYFALHCSFALWAQQTPQNLSLKEAITYALENNRKAQNALYDIEAAKKQKWETIAMGLPQINGSVDYNHFLKMQTSLLPAEIFGGKEGEYMKMQMGTKDNVNAKATLSQLIFDGSYIVGLQSAKVYLQISQMAKEKTDIELQKTVVDAYANVLLSEETIRVLDSNRSVLEKNLYETEQIVINGLGEEESVEQLQITLAGVENSLNNARRLHSLAKKMLNIVLGVAIHEPIKLTDTLEGLVAAAMTENQNTQSDYFKYQNNIDYRIAENTALSQELLLKNEKVKYLPRLSAFISAGYDSYSNEGFKFLNKDQRWFGSAVVGASLSIPIFSSGERAARVRRFKMELDKSKNDLEQIEQEIQLKHAAAQSDFQFSIEQYKTFKENLKLAERIEHKNQIKYKEGIASSFDLRQAQTQLYTAQQEYLQSIVEVLNKKEELTAIIK